MRGIFAGVGVSKRERADNTFRTWVYSSTGMVGKDRVSKYDSKGRVFWD